MSGIEVLQTADAAALAGFDALIDVRSPSEFAEDHLPGAESLPVLSDAERAEVGTIYVQQSRFLARRIGAAHVARNIARHLETALADRPADFRPLIYCWRGGQRSGAMATVLSQVGWRVSVLQGGYRTWRRHVKTRLYDEGPQLNLVLLDGATGSGKTELLGHAAALGVQVLDLEGLAQHRGSLFGALPGRPQPSQKMFESRLLVALDALDPVRPVLVEAESSKIGDRMIPPVLWKAMAAAPRIELVVPREARAGYSAAAYREIAEDRALLAEIFARLPSHPGRQRLENWRALADAGDWTTFAEALMELHYDPAYARSAKKHDRPALGRIEMAQVDAAGLDASARRLRDMLVKQTAA